MRTSTPDLSFPKEGSAIATEVQTDAVDHFLWRDQMHAAGQALHDVQAQVFCLVFFIAITERNNARAPAAAVSATRKRADRVDELVMRVGFPMWRFPSAGNDNARTPAAQSWFRLHRRCEV